MFRYVIPPAPSGSTIIPRYGKRREGMGRGRVGER